ncbi:MAG: nicotinate-nucleotide adenylyltransferase [Pyrinomonadaceae bacterium]
MGNEQEFPAEKKFSLRVPASPPLRVAFYGGSFDPIHNGHLAIARKLIEIFAFDEFVFIPAFHAPHKPGRKPVSAFHRFAMLILTTETDAKIKVSTVELDAPEKPFTFETQTKIKSELPEAQIFFVVGADSWNEIDTWRNWTEVLTLTNIVVVTRPNYELNFSRVTDEIRARIVDLTEDFNAKTQGRESLTKELEAWNLKLENKIFITDAVQMNVSATEIRQMIREKKSGWREFVPQAAADYIEKYNLYLK